MASVSTTDELKNSYEDNPLGQLSSGSLVATTTKAEVSLGNTTTNTTPGIVARRKLLSKFFPL